MKPQLTLRIDKFLEGETLAAGAIVQVRSLQESGSSRVLHRVPVPVTDDSSVHSTVAVDPGRYEVSAVLPSGSVISRVIDVLADDGTVDATLDGGSSPHEWLAWQQWSGNVGERSVARPSPAKSAQSAQPAKSAAAAPPAARAPASAPAVAGADAGADAGEDAGADTGADAAAPQMVPDAIELVSVSPLSGGTREPVWQRLAQQLAELDALQSIDAASIMPPGVSSHTLDIMQDPPYVAVRLPRHAGHTGHRSYLTVSMGGHTMLCVVPWPWGRTDGSSEALVEAVVSVDGDGDNEWSVRTTVRDPMIAGVLSYFVAGEARTARELMGPALDLLYGKMTNPLAAAAGGYVLVGGWIDESAHGTMTGDWMQWVRNLSQWFPWIPDGAILEGWLALRMRGREPLLAEARTALLEAERRGIPYYTAGVRRLVDGLMLISGENRRSGVSDPDVDAALGRARRLAWQLDPAQPFTCVRLWTT